MSRTFLRSAISFAISVFSVSDNIRAARGKINLSSTLMCCLYIDARLATAVRNCVASASDRLPVERYRVPRRSIWSCKGAAQRCSSELFHSQKAATISGSLDLTQPGKQRLFLISGVFRSCLHEVAQGGICSNRLVSAVTGWSITSATAPSMPRNISTRR